MRGIKAVFSGSIVLALLAAEAPLMAQEPRSQDAAAMGASRAELEALLARLESAASPEEAVLASRVRTRLREGDFRVGDPILLVIEGEKASSDTLTVGPEQVLAVPGVGTILLAGVLRSELESRVTAELGRYFKKPVVTVRPLLLLSVTGEVERPGFYMLTAGQRLSDAFMAAGGPTRGAALKKVRIEGGDGRVLEDEVVRNALAGGQTLGHLDIRSGDRVVVPQRSSLTGGELLRILVLAIPATVLAVIQLL